MESQIRIVSTKKLLTNQKQYLLNANFSVVEADFIQIIGKEFKYKNTNNYLIFTSQNAVESVLKNNKISEIKKIKSFCVGEKTRQFLEENGFEVILHADYAAELASVICNQYPKGSFTFFSGNLRRDILPEALELAQISFDEIEVYETILTSHEIPSKPDGLLFFSPSAVESYIKRNTISDQTCFCIGKATAEAAEKITENVITANHPTVENVIIQCLNYYSKK